MHFTHALPRPARNERGEGKSNKTKLLSPTLSSSCVGREGEERLRFWAPISLIQRQCTPALSPEEREKLSCTARHSLISDSFQRGQTRFPLLGERDRVRASHFLLHRYGLSQGVFREHVAEHRRSDRTFVAAHLLEEGRNKTPPHS